MKRNIITTALRNLGVNSKSVQIAARDSIAIVYVDNVYFGIYDFNKKTFVD